METIPSPEIIVEPENINTQAELPVKPKFPIKKLFQLILTVLSLVILVFLGKNLYDGQFSKPDSQETLSPTQAPATTTPSLSPSPSPAPFKIGNIVNLGYTETTIGWETYQGPFYSIKYPKKWNVFKNGFISPNKECETCGGSPLGFNPQAKVFPEANKDLSLLDNAVIYTVKYWGSTDLTEAFPLTIISKSQNRIDALWISSLPGETGHDLLFFQSPEKDLYILDFAGLYDVNEYNKWVDKTYYGELLRKIFSTLEINQISPTPTS